jgi:hypothetical protein
MSVDSSISLKRVKSELERIERFAENGGWFLSEIDQANQLFTVSMKSPIDGQEYILEVIFSDFPELPLILEFIDPVTKQKGTKNAYPKNDDSFFHAAPCICNPCSRKSYIQFQANGPHQDWQLIGWQQNPKVGALITLDSILRTIYLRISSNDMYKGRMV